MTSSTPFSAESGLAIVDDFLRRKPILRLRSGQKKPLIAIIGPTASGKTAFSIDLALKLKEGGVIAEVVNADSRQFYRGLNIGTAKITEKEMEGVPHHLLSVLDPKDECTISWFQKEAKKVIEDIHARGGVPLLVGGSMLYVSAIVDGLEPLSSADPAIRKRLEKEYDADGGVELYERLLTIDPDAVTFARENKIYVIRALEIYEATGKTKSAQKKSSGSPYDTLILGIDRDQKELAERIEQRTKAMFEAGWIEEVRGLLDQGYSESDPAMMSIGYKEIAELLLSVETPRRGVSTMNIMEIISRKTRQYAKRHKTWWKDDSRVQWIVP